MTTSFYSSMVTKKMICGVGWWWWESREKRLGGKERRERESENLEREKKAAVVDGELLLIYYLRYGSSSLQQWCIHSNQIPGPPYIVVSIFLWETQESFHFKCLTVSKNAFASAIESNTLVLMTTFSSSPSSSPLSIPSSPFFSSLPPLPSFASSFSYHFCRSCC